jgi:hypothetical protein
MTSSFFFYFLQAESFLVFLKKLFPSFLLLFAGAESFVAFPKYAFIFLSSPEAFY